MRKSSRLRTRGGGVSVRLVPLRGCAEGPLFKGVVERNAVNVQKTNDAGIRHMTARFSLVGKDAKGDTCRIYVENEGWFNGEISSQWRTTPYFVTDSKLLSSYFDAHVFRGESSRNGDEVVMAIFEANASTPSELSAQDLSDLSRYEYVRFSKGDYIIRQGQEIDDVYFLVSGTCKVSNLTYKGDLIVHDMRHADSSIRCFLGVLSSYRPETSHRTSFIAFTECYCYRLSRREIRNYMLEHPNVLELFMSYVMERYAILENKFLFKQMRNTPGQVCAAIMEYAIFQEGMYWMSPDMNNSRISRLIGANRVTVVRIVQELLRLGILERTDDGVRIASVEEMNGIIRGERTIKYARK